jgi:hypothetical protein
VSCGLLRGPPLIIRYGKPVNQDEVALSYVVTLVILRRECGRIQCIVLFDNSREPERPSGCYLKSESVNWQKRLVEKMRRVNS